MQPTRRSAWFVYASFYSTSYQLSTWSLKVELNVVKTVCVRSLRNKEHAHELCLELERCQHSATHGEVTRIVTRAAECKNVTPLSTTHGVETVTCLGDVFCVG